MATMKEAVEQLLPRTPEYAALREEQNVRIIAKICSHVRHRAQSVLKADLADDLTKLADGQKSDAVREVMDLVAKAIAEYPIAAVEEDGG